ncbi:MAG: NADH-quinone oxidoreductase subunit A [Anaerolineales bacterium]
MAVEGTIQPLWPLLVYLIAVIAVVAGMVGISALLGERHNDPETGETYESGIMSSGSARTPYTIRFYLVAVSFVVFDLEAVFIFAWSLAARKLGWVGYGEMVAFVVILLCALAYFWKMGGLDWGPKRKRNQGSRGTPLSRMGEDALVDKQTGR